MEIWCDLKYAKELYLWGVDQDSLAYWTNDVDGINGYTIVYSNFPQECYYSAPSAEELLHVLPKIVQVDSSKRDKNGRKYTYVAERYGPTRPTWLNIWIEKNGAYTVSYKGYKGYTMWAETDKSLANACAKMFLYLIENRLTSRIYRKEEV